MSDLYSLLGVKRDSNEADIKKAYRKLAKELHPDRNKDNPAAAARFNKVTQAYDLLTDKDKRARYDRGEIDEDGNPKMPFGYTGGGGFRAGAGGSAGGGFRGRPPPDFGAGEEIDLSELFDGLFGGNGQRRGGPGGGLGGFGGFGTRRPPPPPEKGADIAYRLPVAFEDAATLKEQRVTLSGGKTVSIKLPAGVDEGTRIRLAGQGQPGPGGNGDGIVTISIKPHRFFARDGDNIRLDLPVSIDEAVLGAKVKVPTVDGPVMVTVPKGSSSGKVLRLKGKGFAGKGGTRGDQLVTLMVEIPEEDSELARFVEGWSRRGRGNPRGGLGV